MASHISNVKRPIKHPPIGLARLDTLCLDPLPWTDFFNKEHTYANPGTRSGNFHCYTSGTHGKPCIVLIHGGGYSALSFGVLTEYLQSQIPNDVEILAMDLRGHGSTEADETDLNLNTFSDDILALLQEHFEAFNAGVWPEVIFVGHSLGGAIAVDAAHKQSKCGALILLDVTESIAMESLSGMKSLLRGRPSSFTSVQAAIYWAANSKTISNLRSARVSVPGMIKNEATNLLAANERCAVPMSNESRTFTITPPVGTLMDPLTEESEEEEQQENPTSNKSASPICGVQSLQTHVHEEGNNIMSCYTWRIDLKKTEPFWTGWYQNMSEKFLSVNTQAKMLILARSTDALDRDAEMLRGHITGKFMFQTISHSGHMLQENAPELVGNLIIQLLKRHRLINASGTATLTKQIITNINTN